MRRLLVIPLMVGFACVLAGAYGIVHNQISFTIGPDYFYALKFPQFRIPDLLQSRVGAAYVGWQASWWMGLVIGIPIAVMSLGIPSSAQTRRVFLRAAMLVVAITFALGLVSLAFDPPMDHIPVPTAAKDPIGYGRAAMLHDTSYLGGMIGLVIGLIYTGAKVRAARRNALKPQSEGR
ncbi:hypothetical protein SAMN04488030_2046 [Aliiroseovarius halocynthiae]|uniref:Uncharacterized protein n=1 Tax=Aliiroseovarius halocynthiae TaxID=985055 RepID=A0A545SRF6_9RHOB|nr:hypothetical protein [Aliiroseovarius halocynthiae]TQV67561.1 hypothetical protein FIL88_10095 [Aliiroseovarius halocynthiae]SMR81576.1 hypothetical protein SAMN04488030_2046 [Aliiroseovarius halocynthiae]